MIRHTLKYHVYMYAYVYRKVFILKIVLLLMKHISFIYQTFSFRREALYKKINHIFLFFPLSVDLYNKQHI